MKNMKRFTIPLFAGMACIVFFGLLLLYVNYTSGQAMPTFPQVTIEATIPEGSGIVNQPVIVFGEASDPDGIESAELWVNGVMIASQANTDQELYPFEISQSWIPDGPGNYLFLLRGIDRKGFASESPPVMIQIDERTYQSDPTMLGQYIVQQGDTIENIAARFGTTPDEIRRLDPEMGDLTPGESLSVPPRPETDSGGDSPPPSSDEGSAPPAGDGGDELPHISPPSAPSSEGGMPAVPVSAPWWGSLPLPDSFNCTINPAMCAAPTAGDILPLPASDVHASLVDACQVSVSWTDNSTNEAEFRVYRLVTRPRFRFELIALLDPFPDSGGRLSYVDSSAPTGESYYAVATINSRGDQIWSAPSEKMTITCSSSTTADVGRALDVEALEMTISDSSIERLYCYLSLAGSPFERIPEGTSEFITLEGGAWNIAEYASGDSKRTFMMDVTRPLEITSECLGWQGGTLVDLGRFTRSHPPEEWDGHPLISGPDNGAFSVTYRIQPTTSDGTSAGYGGGGGDPSVPVPFNLRATDTWTTCTRFPLGLPPICPVLNEPGFTWDYAVDPGAPRQPLYFKVYRVADGASASSLFYTTLDGTHMSAPRGDCGEHAFYSVSAVVGVDPVSGVEIQSSISGTLEIQPTCRTLEITLVSLYVYGVNDGDPCTIFATCANDYEAYGIFSFNGTPVRWNKDCDGHQLCGGAPRYTVVDEASLHDWADMSLQIAGEGSFTSGNNVIRVSVRDREPLNWNFQLWDHDSGSSDDQWCGFGRDRQLLKGYPLAELSSVDKELHFTPAQLGGGQCDITLRVRGVPGTP